MTHHPHLIRVGPRAPRAVVLLLHGGAEEDHTPLDPRSKPWLRMLLMGLQIGGGLRREGRAVWLLRYRYVGWNHAPGREPAPVADTRWALDRVRERYGEVPVVLLGHSMGARTAVTVADDPSVVGVVGLAPWLPHGEPVEPLRGKRLVAAHGKLDRITLYDATAAFVRRAAAVAESAELVDMGPLDHPMLRGLRRWNAVARQQVRAVLAHAESTATPR